MPYTCPKCGAVYPSGEQCRDRFDACLVKDFEQPTSYYAAHHLIVTCYMLQHNEYSREGWLWARDLLARFVHDGLTPAAARERNRSMLDSGRRAWSMTIGEKLAQVDAIAWTRTIADVRLDTAEHYCADAERWARSLLADTDAMMRALRAP